MRFYTRVHRYYCGIDLHARSMYVCVINQDGEVLGAGEQPPPCVQDESRPGLRTSMSDSPSGPTRGPVRRRSLTVVGGELDLDG